ncbi:MAG TPA: VWA domain-containing protein, partial [Candidatus Cloacimonadota bacterium]|nr:VWA domain-containing protein [Candidatus Cloacimonadota bacterium]
MKRLFMLCLALIALSAVPLFANGVLVVDAEDGDCMQLLSSTVSVQVEDQVAIVTSTQEFTNQFNWPYFPKYAFPLPVGASATRLRWYLNETWYTAIISAVPQDSLPPGPGESWAYNLRQYLGSSPMYYNFEQAVLADQDIKVELTYAMLLPYANGNVNFLYPNDYQWIQSSALDSQILEFDIISQRTIQNVVLQNFSPGIYTNDGNHAHLSLTRLNVPANSNYVLYYTLSLDELGLFTMSTRLDEVPDAYGNGYFLFVAEPDPSDNTEIINKVFTLMIDRSGSMSGTKIVQARNAANFVINHLNPGDMFNIVSFASQVSSFRTEHVPFTTSNQTAALSYIAGLYASGSTNISEAFSTAIPQFNQATDETANIIIFFTDGQPTAGLTNPDQIRTHVTNLVDAANTEIYLYNFGIGSDVNVQLLTWLALDNNGLAEFLGSNDFETTISNFYMTIANPVLIHPTLSFSVPDNISETYPQPLPNLYLGTQMIVAGRYNSPGNINVTLS